MADKELNQYCTLTIDGITYSCERLVNEVVPELLSSDEEWKKEIGSFISLWLSDAGTFTVKTSGSTGSPKEIVIHRSAMIESARRTIGFFDIKPGSSALLCLPARFIAGRMMIVRSFVGGWNITFKNPAALQLANDEYYDFAAMVPLQAERLLESGYNFGNLGALILGGAATSPLLAGKLAGYNVWETYGMTETVSHIALRKCGSSYFRPLDGVNLSNDNRGCLVVDASGIADNVLITNDIVQIEADGSFVFLGRADNVINSGGIKLFPEQIEKKLSQIIDKPFIVAGLPDDFLGQKLVLVVASEENDNQLKEKIAPFLEKYENPKEIFFIPRLFYTPNDKIDRRITMGYVVQL